MVKLLCVLYRCLLNSHVDKFCILSPFGDVSLLVAETFVSIGAWRRVEQIMRFWLCFEACIKGYSKQYFVLSIIQIEKKYCCSATLKISQKYSC